MTFKTTDGSDERKFIHQIANSLGTSMLLLEVLLDALESHSETNLVNEMLQVSQVTQELEKIKTLLVERREILVARGVPSSNLESPLAVPTLGDRKKDDQ